MPAPFLQSNLQPFSVAHFLKDDAGRGLGTCDESRLRTSGFFLDTCLRQVAVIPQGNAIQPANDNKVEWFHDREAYSFLLQTASGLNSAIPGETNILGQFKHGWNQWRDSAHLPDREALAPLLRHLFADSAEIRRLHLQGIGGHSYGSLLRKMLDVDADARILIIGAGELAQSLLPYLRNHDLAIWNRRRPQPPANTRMFLPQHADLAARWATHMVFTTPADPVNDRRWQQLAASGQYAIVHLGCRRARRGIWSVLPAGSRFADLDDLFDLRRRQSSVRSLRVGYARKACQWRAARKTFAHEAVYLPELIAQQA